MCKPTDWILLLLMAAVSFGFVGFACSLAASLPYQGSFAGY